MHDFKQNCPPISEQFFYWWANGGRWATFCYLTSIPSFLLNFFEQGVENINIKTIPSLIIVFNTLHIKEVELVSQLYHLL